jgi:hypothetical protein
MMEQLTPVNSLVVVVRNQNALQKGMYPVLEQFSNVLPLRQIWHVLNLFSQSAGT